MPNGFPVNTGQSCNGGQPVAGYLSDSGGVFDPKPQPISSTATPYVTMPNCSSGNFTNLAKIFAFIPDTDAYGDSAPHRLRDRQARCLETHRCFLR